MAGNHEIVGTDRAATLLEIGPYLSGIDGSGVIERQVTRGLPDCFMLSRKFSRRITLIPFLRQRYWQKPAIRTGSRTRFCEE